MRITRINVSIIRTVVILSLLLIATTLINSVHSSLQQEVTIQSVGSILAEDSFVDKIFFQYGGETGVLQPPWDFVGDERYGIIRVDSAHARTGSRSIYMYQKLPPKSEKERRCHLRYYGKNHKQTELFFSWWAYFDNRWLTDDPEGWGSTLGGWQLWFGPETITHYWWEGGRFRIYPTSRRINFEWKWGKIDGGVDFGPSGQFWDTDYYITDFLNRWVHFQVYVKIAKGNNGVVRAWFNNVLVAEKTGITTDPSEYPEWEENPVDGTECVWRSQNGGPYPDVGPELYQDTDSFESWIWVDDCVSAIQKVAETYRVVGK